MRFLMQVHHLSIIPFIPHHPPCIALISPTHHPSLHVFSYHSCYENNQLAIWIYYHVILTCNNFAGWSILQHNQDVQSLFRMQGSIRQTQDPPSILTIPNSHDKFHSECDASEYALGTVYHNTKTRNKNVLVLLSRHSHLLNRIMKFTTRELLAIMVPLLSDFRKKTL
jgi:hypothetical protein